jgi:uncharacterized RDD family membrane protein YckC
MSFTLTAAASPRYDKDSEFYWLMSSLYAEPVFSRLPKAKIWRRGVASTIDFAIASMLSVIAVSNQAGLQIGQWLFFLLVWFILRVVIVSKNQGQSLGHWALDMKVVDDRFAKIPGLKELAKREGILGLEALLILIVFSSLNLGLVIFLLVAPLAIDCGIALTEPLRRQALHDRVARTVVIQTFRGYSLDLKVKKIFAQARRRMR